MAQESLSGSKGNQEYGLPRRATNVVLAATLAASMVPSAAFAAFEEEVNAAAVASEQSDAAADATEQLDSLYAQSLSGEGSTATVAATDGSADATSSLDHAKLPDGQYTVNIKMMNTNRKQVSMSNGAVGNEVEGTDNYHQMTLDVVDGTYWMTMRWVPLDRMLGGTHFVGYLANLSYYENYETTPYVKGTQVAAKVLSKYVNDDGTPIYDSYNNPDSESYVGADKLPDAYPKDVQIKISGAALDDGWQPVHVFVPVMEAIMAGAGDQNAYVQIDWDTLNINYLTTDKTELKKSLDVAEGMTQGKKSAEAWSTFQSALSSAKAVYDNAASTQDAINGATSSLDAAIETFNQSADSGTTDAYADKIDDGVRYQVAQGLYDADGNAFKAADGEPNVLGEGVFWTFFQKAEAGADGTYAVDIVDAYNTQSPDKYPVADSITYTAPDGTVKQATKICDRQQNSEVAFRADWLVYTNDLNSMIKLDVAYTAGGVQKTQTVYLQVLPSGMSETTSLITALTGGGYMKTSEVDYSPLYLAVQSAKAIEQGKKSDEAFATLQSAIETANTRVNTYGSKQADLDTALETLNAAVDTFNASADKEIDKTYGLETGVWYTNSTDSWSGKEFVSSSKTYRPFDTYDVLYRLNEDGTFTVRFRNYDKLFQVDKITYGEDAAEATVTGKWNAGLGYKGVPYRWDITVSDLSDISLSVTGAFQTGAKLSSEAYKLEIAGLSEDGDHGFAKAESQLDDAALYQAWAAGKAIKKDTAKGDAAWSSLQTALNNAERVRARVTNKVAGVTQDEIDTATANTVAAIESYNAPAADKTFGLEAGVFYAHYRLDDAVSDSSNASVKDTVVLLDKTTYRLTADKKFDVTVAFKELSASKGVYVTAAKFGSSDDSSVAATATQIGGGAGQAEFRATVDSLDGGFYIWATYYDARGKLHTNERLQVKLDVSETNGAYGFTKLASQDDTKKDLYAQITAAKAVEQGNKGDAAWNALQTAIEAAQKVYKSDDVSDGGYTQAAETLKTAVETFNASAESEKGALGLEVGAWYEFDGWKNYPTLAGAAKGKFYNGMFHYTPKADGSMDVDLYAWTSGKVSAVKYSKQNDASTAVDAWRSGDNYFRINDSDVTTTTYMWITYIDDEGVVHEDAQCNIVPSSVTKSSFKLITGTYSLDTGYLYAANADALGIDYGKKAETLWVELVNARNTAAKILKNRSSYTQAQIDEATAALTTAAEAYRTAADDANGGKYGFEQGYHYVQSMASLTDADGNDVEIGEDGNPFYLGASNFEYRLAADGTFSLTVTGYDNYGSNSNPNLTWNNKITAVKYSLTDDASTAQDLTKTEGAIGGYTTGYTAWPIAGLTDLTKPVHLWIDYTDKDGVEHKGAKYVSSLNQNYLNTKADHGFFGSKDGVDTSELYKNLKQAEAIEKDENKTNIAWITFDLTRETYYLFYVNEAGSKTQAEVDEAAKTVADAIVAYKNSANVADFTALDAAVAEAQKLVDAGAGDYQDKAFSLLSAELETAKKVDADHDYSQEKVDATTESLTALTSAYKASATKNSAEALKAKITEATELKAGGCLNGLSPLTALGKAISAAQATYDTVTGFADDVIVGTEAEAVQATTDLQAAIDAFKVANTVNKDALTSAIASAKAIEQGSKTDEAFRKLANAISAAQRIVDNEKASQVMVDAAVENLKAAVDEFNASADVVVIDKTALNEAIASAKAIEQGKKSNEAFQTLQQAISAASKVAGDDEATQDAVDAATGALKEAVSTFNASADVEDALDFNNLADGSYTVTVDMYKMDRESLSMSDQAIDHEVELTVKGGEYYLTFDFQGLKYLGQFGYLGWLKYYDNGYTYSAYGYPQGQTVAAIVLTTQKDEEGNDVYDVFNTDGSESKLFSGLYPDKVQIKYVTDARNDADGYVPLQVFVPVMESISVGNGTQDVLAKVNKASLKKSETAAVDTAALEAQVAASENALATSKKGDAADAKLAAAVAQAKQVLSQEGLTQEEADAAAEALKKAYDEFAAAPDQVVVDKSALASAIASAKGVEQGKKTDSAWEALQAAIAKAEAVNGNADATQADVDTAATVLNNAVDTFNKSADKSSDALDFSNLPAGTYSINIDMYKMNRTDKSMSDAAVNHQAKLEVDEDGTYWLTFDFTYVKSGNDNGYLAKLGYYDEGYTYSGAKVNGTVVAGTVIDTQKDADGNDVYDRFNTPGSADKQVDGAYPNHVKIKFTKTARNDADHFIPLQVFVPIMEAIADDCGTQDVLAKYDVSSLRKATDGDFVDNTEPGTNTNGDTSNNGGTTTNTATTPMKATAGTTATTASKAATATTGTTASSAKTGDDTAAGVMAAAFAGIAAAAVAAYASVRRRFGKQENEE